MPRWLPLNGGTDAPTQDEAKDCSDPKARPLPTAPCQRRDRFERSRQWPCAGIARHEDCCSPVPLSPRHSASRPSQGLHRPYLGAPEHRPTLASHPPTSNELPSLHGRRAQHPTSALPEPASRQALPVDGHFCHPVARHARKTCGQPKCRLLLPRCHHRPAPARTVHCSELLPIFGFH